MKEKVICYIMIYGCYGLFTASNSYDFFNQYCSNLLKNPTVRGLRGPYRTYLLKKYFPHTKFPGYLKVKCISDDVTWISELEILYFMLSMYLYSWWWVHGCMHELQRITTGVMRLVVCDIFILH